MNGKKTLTKIWQIGLILSCLSALILYLPSVSAETITTVQTSTLTTSNTSRMYATHPSTTSTVSAAGEAFTVSEGGYLSSLWFGIKREGTIDGILRAAIAQPYPGTTLGTNMVPNGAAVLAVSITQFDPTELPLSATWVEFVFDKSLELVPGVAYCAYFYIQSINGTWNSSNDVVTMWGTAQTPAPANKFLWASSGWTGYSNSTNHVSLKVDVSDTYGGAATPTPTPSPSPAPTGLPVGTAQLIVDAYADSNVSWNIQGSTTKYYEGTFNLPVGTVIEMTCTPDEGYYFYYWWATFDEGSTQFSLNPLHFTLYYDLSLTAFVDAADLAELQTVTLQNSDGGQIYADYTPENWTGSIRFFAGTYQLGYNSSLTIGGLPQATYQFYRLTFAWNIDGVALSSVEYESPVTVGIIGTLISRAYFTQDSLFPTPNTTGNAGTLGTVLGILTNTNMIALFIMVVVGFVCYLMAGPWGFLAGLNLSAIMLFLASVLELWAVIILVVIDGLLLYGKVSSSKGSPGPSPGE